MRKQVVEITCSRCTRKEYESYEGTPPPPRTFKATLVDPAGPELVIEFTDLCAPCTRTIRNHLDSIGKEIKATSPDRKPKPAGPITHATLPATPGAKKKTQDKPAPLSRDPAPRASGDST
jgi:hypothetical protein